MTREQRAEFFAFLGVALLLIVAGLLIPFPPLTAIGIAVVVFAVIQGQVRARRQR